MDRPPVLVKMFKSIVSYLRQQTILFFFLFNIIAYMIRFCGSLVRGVMNVMASLIFQRLQLSKRTKYLNKEELK